MPAPTRYNINLHLHSQKLSHEFFYLIFTIIWQKSKKFKLCQSHQTLNHVFSFQVHASSYYLRVVSGWFLWAFNKYLLRWAAVALLVLGSFFSVLMIMVSFIWHLLQHPRSQTSLYSKLPSSAAFLAGRLWPLSYMPFECLIGISNTTCLKWNSGWFFKTYIFSSSLLFFPISAYDATIQWVRRARNLRVNLLLLFLKYI